MPPEFNIQDPTTFFLKLPDMWTFIILWYEKLLRGGGKMIQDATPLPTCLNL